LIAFIFLLWKKSNQVMQDCVFNLCVAEWGFTVFWRADAGATSGPVVDAQGSMAGGPFTKSRISLSLWPQSVQTWSISSLRRLHSEIAIGSAPRR
jgi:hypothetical protein